MGVAVLDGPGLLYYGVKAFWTKRPADELLGATRAVIGRLIADYRPAVLAYEQSFYVQSMTSALLRAQEAEIRRVGQREGLRVVGYPPTRVRQLLCADEWATKRRVADLLCRRFPELARYRPSRTPPLQEPQERYWLHMFDALAVGIVCRDLASDSVPRHD